MRERGIRRWERGGFEGGREGDSRAGERGIRRWERGGFEGRREEGFDGRRGEEGNEACRQRTIDSEVLFPPPPHVWLH